MTQSPPPSGPRHGPLVVSVQAREPGELERLARAAALVADVVELRLDALAAFLLRAEGEAFCARLVHALGRPVIATVHGREGFGEFSGTPAERGAVLAAAARAGVAYVDVDLGSLGDAELLGALPAATRRVLSVHTRGAFPADLEALTAPLLAAARAGDIVKVVTEVGRAEDALATLAWLHYAASRLRARGADAPRVTAFCTGAPLSSLTSRVLAPAFGGALVYAASDDADADATAPGQPRAQQLLALWPEDRARLARVTRLVGIAGRPLAHSASPRVHAAAQRALALDALFVPLEAESLAGLMQRLTDPRWVGLSITAPFKVDALRLAASADDDARAVGAANTLVRDPRGAWRAANTDAPAVLTALGGAAEVRGARALVVGAGGAARAAASALAGAGAEVTIAARDAAAGATLARAVAGAALTLAQLADAATPTPPFEVIVHTTPLGTDGRGVAPVPRALLGPGVRVLDAVYRPQRTALVRLAEAEGARASAGRAWFLAQAEAQLARWHGRPAALPSAVRAEAARAFDAHVREGSRARDPVAPYVVLLGLRCVGKSTVGARLAARLGVPFVDLDVALAAAFEPARAGEGALVGRPAGELLEALGEERFRALERAALAAVLAAAAVSPAQGAAQEAEQEAAQEAERARGLVLATGGGVVESAENRAALAALAGRATVVWFHAPAVVLARRLESSRAMRPSLTGAAPLPDLEHLARRRERWYRALSDVEVDACGAPEQVLADVLATLRSGPGVRA